MQLNSTTGEGWMFGRVNVMKVHHSLAVCQPSRGEDDDGDAKDANETSDEARAMCHARKGAAEELRGPSSSAERST